ncbi:CubicO group peptidase (beta-lactamase class C family) [Nocardioides albertanoniae]|uniref:CubicO group peptidase (Beta-lactamase class C family) n=1 Tax=Nocardioides albertanoniae TaxID=1175486 RepID=A0A543A1B5_9ACTN|nr:serine hydrolase [Nocardioides albertanoniae]TQL66381.1 CubicO group peptidase (beta-lactamase class C family) [Nocardioides albertanoniae]
MRRLVAWILAAGVVGALLSIVPAGSATAAVAQKRCDLPSASDSFATSTPAQQSLDAQQVSRAVDLLSTRLRLSVKVFRNNCLVAKSRLDDAGSSVHNNVWSVTKSVTSLLTGIAVGDGKLHLDDPIGRHLPKGPGWGDAAHRAITVRQLLTQTSGTRQAILAEAASTAVDPNLAREALAQPFVHKPGTKFQYSQLGPALLAYVVQRAVGKDLVAFAQERLFGPIGIESGSYFWLRDRSGLAYGYNGLFLKPAQLARLGLLMSNDGRWQGTQVVPASYVSAVGRPTPTNGCYGLLFWSNRAKPCTGADIPGAQTLDRRAIPSAPADAYEMNGTGGQLVVMIPSLDMTVVTTGYFGSLALDPPVLLGASPDEMQWTFFRELMAAVEDVDVADPGPYPGDPISLDVDPRNYLDPAVLTSDLLTNPHCNVVFCDGTIPTKGLVQNLQALPGLL